MGLVIEGLITLFASCGGMGAVALLLCSLSARRSQRHPAFRWWFWRLGLVPLAASAYAIFIRLTPREQVEGCNVDFGFLDFVAVIYWGLLVPSLYLIVAGLLLLVMAFWPRGKA